MKILNRYANVASIAHLIALMTFKLSTMIDARELRIGNWVNTPREDQNPFRIDEVELMDKSFGKIAMTIMEGAHPLTWYLEHLQPVPLTPEALVKCGFVTNSNFWYNDDSDICINTDMGVFIITDADVVDVPHIKHLHQLQNLHFSLTGTELNYQP